MSDLETKAGEAKTIVETVLHLMGMEARVLSKVTDDRIMVDIQGDEDEAGILIGRQGQTLEALQYLVSRMLCRDLSERVQVSLDIEGYRERREESLVELAHRLSEKALRTNQTVVLDPMSPQDRRVIHVALDKVSGITTQSEGEGAQRRLLIIPTPDKLAQP